MSLHTLPVYLQVPTRSRGPMTLFKVLTLVPLLLTARRTLAQVACKDGWDWMNNTAGLNPCQIVESLDSWCLGVQFTVPELPDGSTYAPPTNASGNSTICDCNTRTYTLISACAACQGAGWVKWSEWSADCGVASVDDVGDRPEYIVTTSIPYWAFMNVIVNDTFIPETAEILGDLPEQNAEEFTTSFTPTGSSTLLLMKYTSSSTSSPTSSSTSSPTSSPTSSSTGSFTGSFARSPARSSVSSASSSSSDLPSVTGAGAPEPGAPVGAIAGSTVGGLAVLCLVGFILLFFRKRGSKVPKIRRASGPVTLLGSQVGRSDSGTEETGAAKYPIFYDPTNPATFLWVRAELEKYSHPGGGTQSSVGCYDYDPYHHSQYSSNDNNHR